MLCKKCGSYNPDDVESCSVCKEPLFLRGSGSIRRLINQENLLVPIKSTINERYLITRFIGEGSFAQVFYAIDKATNSGVALKIFKPYVFKDEGEMSRLMWGIRGIKDISHPNLVRIFDSDISVEGWVYVSMKFIYGMSLANTIKLRTDVNKPFSFEEIEPLFFQLGEILNEMHPTLCHGDLKPSNIIIQPDYIKLTDTTILSYINITNCINHIKEDRLHIYLAPEVLGGSEPSYRSDIYSCGRILLTLLAGTENPDLERIDLFKYNKDIDTKLKNIIKKATSVDPLMRYGDINELNNELFETLAIYNDLPQAIKDEYHQTISAVETKFTHIKRKWPVSLEEKGPIKKTGSGTAKWRISLIFLAVLMLIGAGVFLIFNAKIRGQFTDKISLLTDIDAGILLDTLSIGIYDAILTDEGEDVSFEDAQQDATLELLKIVEDTHIAPSIETKKVSQREKGLKKIEKTKKEEMPDETEKISLKEQEWSGPCPKDMIYIKAGSFKFGSLPTDEGRQPDEAAFVSVQTGAYCIDRYEYPNKKGVLPKGSVTFADAERMCGDIGKRLCSEEEWERACKGVSMVRYPYDNQFDPSICNAESNTGEDRVVAPSGKFSRCKSTYGVYDMSGNLAEWVYMKGEKKGVKGGYVNKPDWAVRCASRKVEQPQKRSPYYGVRCCMDASE